MRRRLARIEPRFQPGETFRYALSRVRTRRRDGETTSASSSVRFAVTVVGPIRSGIALEWHTLSAESPEVAGSPVATALLELTRGLRFRYRVTPRGRYRRVVDGRDVRRRMAAALDLLAEGLPAPVRTAIEATLSADAFEAHYIREAPLLHAAYAISCPAGGETFVPTVLQSPLGGAPIPAVERVEHRAGDGTQELTLERILEAEPLRLSVLAQLGAMAARMGRPAPGPEDLKELLILDRATHVLDDADGWPRKIRFVRESYLTCGLEIAGQGETLEIARVG